MQRIIALALIGASLASPTIAAGLDAQLSGVLAKARSEEAGCEARRRGGAAPAQHSACMAAIFYGSVSGALNRTVLDPASDELDRRLGSDVGTWTKRATARCRDDGACLQKAGRERLEATIAAYRSLRGR